MDKSLPRIRGGVSRENVSIIGDILSSPHTRGCFQTPSSCRSRRRVFPAYAGVFPLPVRCMSVQSSLPRIRGGVSRMLYAVQRHQAVFPAYAGVFLEDPDFVPLAVCLPRIRGGVSFCEKACLSGAVSSPHTRGCFPLHRDYVYGERVFPAYAGVFLGIA